MAECGPTFFVFFQKLPKALLQIIHFFRSMFFHAGSCGTLTFPKNYTMKLFPRLLTLGLIVSVMTSCQKDQTLNSSDEPIGDATLAKISALGFGTSGVQKHEDGYLVEGDIVLTNEMLNGATNNKLLRIANEEQYRTTNLVTGLPRVITISVASNLPSSYVTATDEAIARYNAEGLQITMQRVSSGADIAITAAPKNAQYLASAGFPTSNGAPYNKILVSTRQIGNQPQPTVASILAHEIGHCIGFRHTDYMSRQYSCGGSPVNEGASTVGAIQIPGTPSGPDSGSWMLACIGGGQNRPFNNNDKVALGYLY